MSQYTVIQASKEQAEKLYRKHMRWGLFGGHFSYDDEDNIGFCSFYTITGKKITCQLRGECPCFVEFTGFGDIRYDIAYPDQLNDDMSNMLKDKCNKLKKAFWKGAQI